MEVEAQIGAAVAVAQRHLGQGLVGACLYGSATDGGLRRFSAFAPGGGGRAPRRGAAAVAGLIARIFGFFRPARRGAGAGR